MRDAADVVTGFLGAAHAVVVWGVIALICAVPLSGLALAVLAVWLAVTGG